MTELFKTVLILSSLGFALTATLLCIKPVTAKKFPARWQYYIWITVMLCMVVPVYKFIPEATVDNIIPQENEPVKYVEVLPVDNVTKLPTQTDEYIAEPQKDGLDFSKILSFAMRYLPYVWVLGMIIYLVFAFSSYFIFLWRKRKNSSECENEVFEKIKQELSINRRIPLRMASDISSPVLVGVFFPKVYVPCGELDEKQARMVFMHELTHYKRHDLAVKWFSLFVNAIHWFNPLSYLLCRNISDACEVSCDIAVTKNMTQEEQKLYMKTILDFAR
ncbi:MAG: M56 family metallopeptidase [Ruminococcaceae bacterium]|nr:M56 family metallopeptidase [Oscillospiraceae bacterium]